MSWTAQVLHWLQGLASRSALVIIGVLLIGLLVLRSVTSAWLLREEAVADWRRDLNNLSLLLAENTAQSITAAELVLTSVADEVQAGSAGGLQAAFDNQQTHQMLRHKISGVPQVAVATIVDAQGAVVVFTRAFPTPPTDLAGRDYFAWHRTHPGSAVHLSAPVQNKNNGKWTFYLSRRIDRSDGAFMGIVLVGLSCDYFSDFFRRTSIGEDAAVSLYRRDYSLLARWPTAPDLMGRQNRSGTTFGIIERGLAAGVMETTSPRGAAGGKPVHRLGAARLVRGQPLIVNVTITDDVFLANWRHTLKAMGGATLINLVALVLALAAVDALLRRRERDAARARALQNHAEAANAAKSRFLAMVSHEIRNPLGAIAGTTALLRETALDSAQRDYAGNIATSADNLLRILNDILDLSKVEAGQMAIDIDRFDPRAVVRDVLALYQPQAARKHLQLTADIDAAVPPAMVSDRARIAQVLGNLVSNAIKFTPAGAVRVMLAWDGTWLGFAVQDSGIGMTPAQLERLFQPYVQGDAKVSGLYGGTGLGLAICRQLAELLGGEIGCTSTAGTGSRFSFRIPCTAAAPVPAAVSAVPAEALAPAATARILLVDDTAMNLQLTGMQLRRRGHQVDTAENGALALAALAQQPYDIVLMDCMMPVMDGYQACRALRAREASLGMARTPVIALTAASGEEDRAMCREAGMDDYLIKPIAAAQLYARIDFWLAQSGN